MKYYLSIFLLQILFFQFLQAQTYTKDFLEVDYEKMNTSKNNYTFKKLRLYPIKANQNFLLQSKDMGKYTPLKKALAQKTVVITETEAPSEENNHLNPRQVQNNDNHLNNQVDTTALNFDLNTNQNIHININQNAFNSGATVNTLFIENTSKDTLYIMAGEIVQGGKQDRVIAKDMVIPPNSGKIDMSVFCVEHGRWSYTGSDNFDNYFGVSSMNMRGVVDKKQNQQEVWNEVERANAQIKVTSKTDAYTERNKSVDFLKEMEAYTNFFQKKFKNENNIVGVVVVTGNRVAGCDIFATPDLFQAQFSSLLSSYINEAITDGAEVNISQNTVEKYMNDLLQSEQKQEEFLKKKGKVYKNKKKKLHLSSY